MGLRLQPQAPGESTEAILAELGIEIEEAEALQARGVVTLGASTAAGG
jgi:crotonobetainyl-CoA:carnitine CoA-transferase CaiB-like acyl-CoA transferase